WGLTKLFFFSRRRRHTRWTPHALKNATADFSEESHELEAEWEGKTPDKGKRRTCGPVAFLIDGKDNTGWRADRGPGRRNSDSVAAAQFEKPLDLPEGTKLRISLRMNHGGDDN